MVAGLHYNYFRTYDPSAGRYLESDPIGLVAGPNTYSYVSNMPTTRTDPFGLVEWEAELSGGAIAYGGGLGFFDLVLRSKGCWDGQRATVRVKARGPAFGAGAKWTLPFTGWEEPVEFDARDKFDYINIENMNGGFAMAHGSFGIGVAGYMFLLRFGDISANDAGVGGGGYGIREGTIEAGAFDIVGSANVVDYEIDSCGCGSE